MAWVLIFSLVTSHSIGYGMGAHIFQDTSMGYGMGAHIFLVTSHSRDELLTVVPGHLSFNSRKSQVQPGSNQRPTPPETIAVTTKHSNDEQIEELINNSSIEL